MLQRSSLFKLQQHQPIKTNSETVIQSVIFTASMLFSSMCFAQSMSFQQAEINILKDSYSTQANQALEQASRLEAEAIKGIGLPRVDLNVRAYAFHNEVDVPLGALKNNLEQSLSNGVNNDVVPLIRPLNLVL